MVIRYSNICCPALLEFACSNRKPLLFALRGLHWVCSQLMSRKRGQVAMLKCYHIKRKSMRAFMETLFNIRGTLNEHALMNAAEIWEACFCETMSIHSAGLTVRIRKEVDNINLNVTFRILFRLISVIFVQNQFVATWNWILLIHSLSFLFHQLKSSKVLFFLTGCSFCRFLVGLKRCVGRNLGGAPQERRNVESYFR